MKAQASISTEREPAGQSTPSRPTRAVAGRNFQPPDAAMPGPLARFHPLDADPDENEGAGGDSFEDRDSQNSDRI